MRTMTKEVSTQNKQRREVKFFGLFSLSFGSCSEHPKERNNNCGLKEDEEEALTAAEKEKAAAFENKDNLTAEINTFLAFTSL